MIHKENGRILCAAVHYLTEDPDIQDLGPRPSNIDNGIVVIGFRYSDCEKTLNALIGDIDRSKLKLGFLTGKNLFVDRHLALKIAKLHGQVSRKFQGVVLCSTDLY